MHTLANGEVFPGTSLVQSQKKGKGIIEKKNNQEKKRRKNNRSIAFFNDAPEQQNIKTQVSNVEESITIGKVKF